MTDKFIAIIQTGETLPCILEQQGDFDTWFINAMEIDNSQSKTFRVFEKIEFPKPENLAGIIITGSASMVTQELEWSEKTIKWLRGLLHKDIPVLGVCYGHQLLAKALGGTVDWNPLGREIGQIRLHLTPQAKNDNLFKNLIIGESSSLDFYATHLQSVTKLPDEVSLLGSTSLDPYHCFRYKKNIWGLQFHPEFSPVVIQKYIQARSDDMISEGLYPNTQLQLINNHTSGSSLLKRFKDICFSA